MPEPDNANDGEVWYIPHFAVAHPRTKKLRVVFDGKASYHGTSFNSHLLQGPEHMNSLFGILCRFRRESIAICCDIQKMFYNFYVKEADRDYLRFLWMGGKKIRKYRMKVHLFGAKSSPAVATYGLRKIAEEHRQISEKAYIFINKDFYVDDGITSAATLEEAVALINNTRSICERDISAYTRSCQKARRSWHKCQKMTEQSRRQTSFKSHCHAKRLLGWSGVWKKISSSSSIVSNQRKQQQEGVFYQLSPKSTILWVL